VFINDFLSLLLVPPRVVWWRHLWPSFPGVMTSVASATRTVMATGRSLPVFRQQRFSRSKAKKKPLSLHRPCRFPGSMRGNVPPNSSVSSCGSCHRNVSVTVPSISTYPPDWSVTFPKNAARLLSSLGDGGKGTQSNTSEIQRQKEKPNELPPFDTLHISTPYPFHTPCKTVKSPPWQNPKIPCLRSRPRHKWPHIGIK